MALSSFFRRVCGSKLPLPIRSVVANFQNQNHNFVGRQLIPYLRFSTSIESEVLRVLDSDISTSSDSTQVVDNGDLKILVGNGDLSISRTYKDEIIILETFFDDITCPKKARIFGHIFKGDLHMQFPVALEPDMIAIEAFAMRDYCNDHLKEFDKFLDVRGINHDLTKFLFEKLKETGDSVNCSNGVEMGYNSRKYCVQYLPQGTCVRVEKLLGPPDVPTHLKHPPSIFQNMCYDPITEYLSLN